MSLAIFDLDNTLIAGDSDDLWGQYLVDNNIRDAKHFGQQNDAFYQDYLKGCLDIKAFLSFQLQILTEYPTELLHQWRTEFIDTFIRPLILPKAVTLIAEKRAAGDDLLIITATNRFLTAPIADLFKIDQLIAPEVECINGRYTGKSYGVPSYGAGKVSRLDQWLQTRPHSLSDSWFYSDSHNDLPLLQLVNHPVAVDPDENLKQIASVKGWDIISLRG